MTEGITHEERKRATEGVHRCIVSGSEEGRGDVHRRWRVRDARSRELRPSGAVRRREAIEGFFRFVREIYPDMDLENIKVMIDTPEQAFAEYEFTAQSSKNGRTIHELFFGRLVAENGKIKLLREAVNLVEVAPGVLPNGLADYKAPSEHKA